MSLTPEQIRTRHFERLNNYRLSKEYQASPTCWQKVEGDFPSLLGDRWEIDADIYCEFLDLLPPLGMKNGSFYMSEFSFDDITAKFTQEGSRYYCEFARYPERRAA